MKSYVILHKVFSQRQFEVTQRWISILFFIASYSPYNFSQTKTFALPEDAYFIIKARSQISLQILRKSYVNDNFQ